MKMKPWHVSAENANDIPLSKHSQVKASHAGLGLILETESDNTVQNHQLRGGVLLKETFFEYPA